MSLTSASSYRRTACGLCLMAGPALILVAAIVDPTAGEGGGDDRKYLQALKDDPDMAQLSTALWVVGFALVAVGLIGLVHVIRERGVVLANLGGTLAIFGLIMLCALVTTTIGDLNAVETLGIDAAVRLSDGIEDYWVAFVVLVPALLGTLLGFVLLAVAMIRSKVFHVAAGALVIAGIVLVAAGSDSSQALSIVANALLLAGYGMAGLRLLGMTDAQWEGRESPAGPPVAGPGATGPAAPPPAA